MVAVLFLGLAVLLLFACSDEMEVQQSYPFKVENMPVPTRIVKGETVEIRCELKREGHFSDARYTIRYFQPDGKGTLRMDDGMVLLPNDRYVSIRPRACFSPSYNKVKSQTYFVWLLTLL